MENKVMDYEQVLKKLRKFEYYSDTVKREKSIGSTTYGLPILHYTIGSGKNHVVLSAAQHGCEIITTDFLLRIMDKIDKKHDEFTFLNNNEYTLHFLPMLNPEGYLIATSTIRKVIKRETLNTEAQEIYKDYLDIYRKDVGDCKLNLNTKVKRHQRFFGHIDPYIILNNGFSNIQKKLIRLYEENDIPKGTLATWSSNANGVDLNQNTPYNYKVQAIRERKNSIFFVLL